MRKGCRFSISGVSFAGCEADGRNFLCKSFIENSINDLQVGRPKEEESQVSL